MSEKSIQRISITLSVISLLADLIALAQLSFSIIARGQTSDILLQFIGVILIFLFGVGLGTIGIRGYKAETVENILRVFIWAYLIMACLTYAGIVIQFRQPYSLTSFISYFIVLAIQILAFTVLRMASQIKHTISYAFAFLAMAVLHGLIWLFHLIFIGYQEPMQIIGEWFLWLVWTLYATPIIREGFKSKKKSTSFIQD